ncbi:DUF2267 domain-containing protein [Mycobacterium sp. 1274761.0]|uniref:DUF2267 domain-containing protein n=1 Tax=Mycobacterium sp. 1274761.0 TaxID=1834077 RepID=UPI000B07648B|nr:DUF2267 domain-containing protein [Mycobacterium sp. 1274761.0]
MKVNHDEFMQRVENCFGYDFGGETRDLVDAVLIALRNDFITDGEWDDVRSVLPKELADALP